LRTELCVRAGAAAKKLDTTTPRRRGRFHDDLKKRFFRLVEATRFSGAGPAVGGKNGGLADVGFILHCNTKHDDNAPAELRPHAARLVHPVEQRVCRRRPRAERRDWGGTCALPRVNAVGHTTGGAEINLTIVHSARIPGF